MVPVSAAMWGFGCLPRTYCTHTYSRDLGKSSGFGDASSIPVLALAFKNLEKIVTNRPTPWVDATPMEPLCYE